MANKTLDIIKEHDCRWVDLRFTDTKGKEQHVTIPARDVDDEFFEFGKMFDGSSIAGWKGINESDMILLPDDSSAVLDPFFDDVAGRVGIEDHLAAAGIPTIILGPGNIAQAHTKDEFIALTDLESGTEAYVDLTRALLK